MNTILKNLIDLKKVVIYMDNILIFIKILKKHQNMVQQVLQQLQEHNFYAKLEKYIFKAESIKFLELIISHNTLCMDSVKVVGIIQWPEPQNIKNVQSFLGIGNFYCWFIKDFFKIASSLFNLTKKSKT